MALDKTRLKDRIKSNLRAAGFQEGAHAQFEQLAKAIADAVVEEVQEEAEVAGIKVQ